MPNMDGTGPNGNGPDGRGLGNCGKPKLTGTRRGRGTGRGLGRGRRCRGPRGQGQLN